LRDSLEMPNIEVVKLSQELEILSLKFDDYNLFISNSFNCSN
jgi:hypothetical protein